MDAQKAKEHSEELKLFYTRKDLVMYALGVGSSATYELKNLYDDHEDFVALPTFVQVPAVELVQANLKTWPGLNLDVKETHLDEVYIKMFSPLPKEGNLRCVLTVPEVVENKDGAFIICQVVTYNHATNEKLTSERITLFKPDAKVINGVKTSRYLIPGEPMPNRRPDMISFQKTDESQATLFRVISPYLNPPYLPPNAIKEKGLVYSLQANCVVGFCLRHILTSLHIDCNAVKAIKVKFMKTIFSGEVFRIEMWRNGTRVHFQAKIAENDQNDGPLVVETSFLDTLENLEVPKE